MSASYAKLHSGAWGVRVTGASPRVGATVVVAPKNGRAPRAEVIAAIVYRGSGMTLCAIATSGRATRRCSCGSIEEGVTYYEAEGRHTWAGPDLEEYSRNSDYGTCRHDA